MDMTQKQIPPTPSTLPPASIRLCAAPQLMKRPTTRKIPSPGDHIPLQYQGIHYKHGPDTRPHESLQGPSSPDAPGKTPPAPPRKPTAPSRGPNLSTAAAQSPGTPSATRAPAPAPNPASAGRLPQASQGLWHNPPEWPNYVFSTTPVCGLAAAPRLPAQRPGPATPHDS